MSQSPRHPEGSSRKPMPTVLKIIVAIVVLALAVAIGFGASRLLPGVGQATGSPSPLPTPALTPASSATASETAAPTATASPTPVQSAASSEGDVLLSFTQACDVTPPVLLPVTTILEDGRVIWQNNAPDGFQWVVRRLSEAGLASVRARIAGTGLLDRDAEYTPQLREGLSEGPPHGLCFFTFDHRDGSADATVGSVMWFGDEEEAAYFEPAPERRELDAFAQQLRDPEAWLSPTDWDDPAWEPHVPGSFLVLAAPVTFGEPSGPALEQVAWPFDLPPSTYGDQVGFAEPRPRCAMAPRDAVERLVAGQTQPDGGALDLSAPSSSFNVREGETWYSITLWGSPAGIVDCGSVA